jgi:hypothetical protein
MRIIVMFTACCALSSLAWGADPVKGVPPQQKTLASPNGRYVFGQVSDFRSDQYMLDTQTGRLWRVTLHQAKNSDGSDAGISFPALDLVPYADSENKFDPTPK